MDPHNAGQTSSFPHLEDYRIKALPNGAYYIPNFITEEDEEMLLRKITTSPASRWKTLRHRRLQAWPTGLMPGSNALITTSATAGLPHWLTSPVIAPLVTSMGIFANSPHRAPNHVLINEYRPGQGIMPHEDGLAYWPLVATVSLGGATVLDIHRKKDRECDGHDERNGDDDGACGKSRILQESRSLLVTTGEMYTQCLHGIAEVEADEDLREETVCNWQLLGEKDKWASQARNQRTTRISLTFRDVPKVKNLAGRSAMRN